MAVNATIADMVHGLPPFPYVRESLEMLQTKADAIVVRDTRRGAGARVGQSTTSPGTCASLPARRWARRNNT